MGENGLAVGYHVAESINDYLFLCSLLCHSLMVVLEVVIGFYVLRFFGAGKESLQLVVAVVA